MYSMSGLYCLIAIRKTIINLLQVIVRLFMYLSITVLDLLIVNSLHRARKNNLTANFTASAVSGGGLVKPPGKVETAVVANRTLEAGRARRLRASRSITKTLLLSSLFFLLSQLLEVVMSILVLCHNPPLCTYQITMPFLLIFSPIQAALSTSYFACSFFVYISPLMYLRSRKSRAAAKLLHGSSSGTGHGSSAGTGLGHASGSSSRTVISSC